MKRSPPGSLYQRISESRSAEVLFSLPQSMKSLLIAFVLLCASSLQAEDLKIGIIGSDSSHVPAFTRLLNDPSNPKNVPGARVVALFKSFSPDIAASAERHTAYERELQEKWGVRVESSIEGLLEGVDAVMIESVDGRVHLEQARPVIAAGKPLFIDKPVAASLEHAVEIFKLAREAHVPVFSSSPYRFYDAFRDLQKADVGEVKSVISIGPAALEPSHPDLFWYAIHPTEALFALMGVGCQSVSRAQTETGEMVCGLWKDGRMGILHGVRKGPLMHRAMVFGSKAFAEQRVGPEDYAPLVREIVAFFQTGIPPVGAEETLDMFAFMEAAHESKRRGGAPVAVAEVLEKASQQSTENP